MHFCVCIFILIRVYVCVCMLSCDWLFVILWFVAHQTPLSMEFSTQEYWSGLPCSTSRGSFQPREWTCTSCCSSIAGRFFTTEPPGKPSINLMRVQMQFLILLIPGEPWDFILLTRSWETPMKQVLDYGHSVSKPGCGYVFWVMGTEFYIFPPKIIFPWNS